MPPRILLLTTLAMLAFAGNSLLCRIALRDTAIDPASFTGVRLLGGALTLWLLMLRREHRTIPGGDWYGAAALFVYVTAFSFAYLHLDAGTGALLLFGAVQLSMIVWGVIHGERFGHWQVIGLILAMGGLVFLLLPGSSAPSWQAALLMLASGVAWGIYSLRGRGTANPLNATAGNFVRAVPLGILLSLSAWNQLQWDIAGLIYALLSGALASGVGYAIWYSALPGLTAIQAASVQLSVPLLTALAGALLLGEALTDRLLIAGTATLCGIALVMLTRKPEPS